MYKKHAWVDGAAPTLPKSFKEEKHNTCSLLFTTGRKFRNTTTPTEVVKTNGALPQQVEQYST